MFDAPRSVFDETKKRSGTPQPEPQLKRQLLVVPDSRAMSEPKICRSIQAAVDASLDAALVLDIDGRVVHENFRAHQIFYSGEHILGDGHNKVESFFIFEDGLTWYDAVGQLKDNDGRDHQLHQFDGNGFDGDGNTFPVTVSLANLHQAQPNGSGAPCSCCSTVLDDEMARSFVDRHHRNDAQPRTPLIVAYIRENNDRQQHFVRFLEKEVRRLQSTQSAMDASFDAFIAINPSGIILSVNKAATTMFGWEQDEMIGNNIAMIMNTKDGNRHSEYIRRYIDSGVKKMIGIRRELRAKTKDGVEFPCELGLVELKSQYGEEVVFCAFIRDLSLQKGHEANMQNKDQLTNALIDASFDPVFLVTSNGTIELCNSAASNLFGYSKDEFIGQNIALICNDHDASNHSGYMERYLKTGVQHVIGKKRVLIAKKRNGETFPIELGLKETELSNEKVYFAGFVRDMTNEKIEEEKLSALIEASFDPMITVSERGIIERANSATVSVFGYSLEELQGMNVSALCNETDGKKHNDYIARYLATGQKRVMGKERELAASKSDGSIFPMKLGLTEVTLRNGSRMFCGFIKDLTQQKLDQDRIKRKEQLMTGLISSSFDGIFLINERGVIQMANQAAVDHFGYSMDELVGNSISQICYGEHAKRHDQYMRNYLRTGERKVIGRRRQVMARTKDGRALPIELGIQEINTVWGEVFFAGFCRDVRREQWDEEELREQEIVSEAIVEAMADALLVLDEAGKVYRCNKAFCTFFGLTSKEVLDASFVHFFGSDFVDNNRIQDEEGMAKFIRRSLSRSRMVEAMKRSGTLHNMELQIFEINGAFPVLLGGNYKMDDSTTQASHLYAAFLREIKDSGTSNNNSLSSLVGNLSEGLRNLGTEKEVLNEEDRDRSAHAIAGVVGVLTSGLKGLAGKKNDGTADASSTDVRNHGNKKANAKLDGNVPFDEAQ